MGETKYGKYLISNSGVSLEKLGFERGISLAYLDDTVIKGSYFYRIMWMVPKETPYPSHGPHIHKAAELLIHLGTNPDDPFDLGAEVEMCMGKEMEKHIITRSTVVYIPPNFIHCPWIIRKVYRPWIFIQINQSLMHTLKSYPQLLPKEEREKHLRGEDEGF